MGVRKCVNDNAWSQTRGRRAFSLMHWVERHLGGRRNSRSYW